MMNLIHAAPIARIGAAREVVALDAGTPMADAARVMAERKIGSVGVREEGELVGLVTERDLVVTALARGGSGDRPMREAMRPGLPRVGADASEADCAALMRDHATSHLLVEEGGRVVGVVSMTDVVLAMLDEKDFVIDQLNTFISGR